MTGGTSVTRRIAGSLCALVLLVAPPWRTVADDAKPLTAMLLVARADILDPSFGQSVVLVMNHLADGPVGVIINRPTRMAVAELFPDQKQLAGLPDKVYFGGPVEIDVVWFLFHAARRPAHAVEAFPGVYLSGDRDLLLKLLGREKPMEDLKIFVGHSGWAPGQLEMEIERGDWTLERAESEAVFEPKAVHPWPDLKQPAIGT